MKKRVLTLIVLTTMVAGSAWSQAQFGIRAGVNFQNLNGKDDMGDKLENDLTLGFHAGVDVDIPVAQDFYFQPGLLFSTKGASDSDGKISFGYVELPLHFVYKPVLGSGKLILGLGPYVAYGVTGKIKPEDGPDVDVKFKNKLTEEDLMDEFNGEVLHFKGLDAGADIFFGYQFAFNFYAQLNAQLGLLDLWPDYDGDDEDETIIKNTGFGISLGYKF